LLRLENEKWCVYGVDMSAGGMNFTMNFEDPEKMFEDMMAESLKMLPDDVRAQVTPQLKKQMLEAMKKEFDSYK
jgi:hypothetical protein